MDYKEVLKMAGVKLSDLVKATHSSGEANLSVDVNISGDVIAAYYAVSNNGSINYKYRYSIFNTGYGSQKCFCDACQAGKPLDSWIDSDDDWIAEYINLKIANIKKDHSTPRIEEKTDRHGQRFVFGKWRNVSKSYEY